MKIGLTSMFYKYVYGAFRNRKGGNVEFKEHLQLTSCINDSAAMQVILSSEHSFLLTTSKDCLQWKKGKVNIVRVEVVLDQIDVRTELKIIGLVEDDDRNLKSDILLDQTSIFVESNMIQQLWVELHTTMDTKPGIYKGQVNIYSHSMFESEERIQSLTFELNVKKHILPLPQNYSFHLDLWQHNSNIARKYEVELWSDEHFRIMDEYIKSLSLLGQKAITLVVSEMPWAGQQSFHDRNPSDFFEYSIVYVYKKNEQFYYDFSQLDRYVEMAMNYGIDAEIEIFGLLNVWQDPDSGYEPIVKGYPDGIRVRYYDENEKTFKFIRECDDLVQYIKAIEQHFIDKQWINLVRILADEPADIEDFTLKIDALRSIAPLFKYKVAINHAEFIKQKLENVEDYIPIIQCIVKEQELLAELRSYVPGKLMYYVCCQPDRPNTFINSPALESRVIPWVAEFYQLDGFLRWNYTVWTDNPLESITYRYPVWKAGDTHFVYPGKTGRPMLSLRYKWLQRGIRDYELMQYLKSIGKDEVVQTSLAKVVDIKNVDQLFEFVNPEQVQPSPFSNDENDYDLHQFLD